MSIKKTLFLLFLYVLLVWMIAAGLSLPDLGTTWRRGLLWSVVGVGALFLWHIFLPIFGWWKLRRLQPSPLASQSPVLAKTQQTPGNSELAALIAEADALLARAPEMANRRVRDLPLYLLVGSAGSGKTSLIHNAGIDARLLAGQVFGSGTGVSGTRLANLWLANECIFLEVSGQVFDHDPEGFAQFLRTLQPSSEPGGWLALWNAPAHTPRFKGVILCYDVRILAADTDRSLLAKNAASIRDRLFLVAEVFRLRCPVYAMFTRADATRYFSEYFDRLPEAEAGQPFGVLTMAENGAVKPEEGAWSEVALKKRNREFNNLFLCLNARRLINLSNEPAPSLKPAIYEFPREFRRIRAPLGQFLVDIVRPDPLRLSPDLRGFFFCGIRKMEAAAAVPSDSMIVIPSKEREESHEATRIFRPDATVFSTSAPVGLGSSGGLVEKAVFTKDFFQQVLPGDRPPASVVPVSDPRLERNWKLALASAGALALLLSTLWTVSWARNRSLVNDVEVNSSIRTSRAQDLSLDSLRALDNLRLLLVRRLDQPKSMWMNWGLYTGNEIREEVRRTYFGRLQQLLLNGANERLVGQLAHATAGPPADPYEAVLDRLKTHLSITGGNCSLDARVVSTNLKQAAVDTHRDLDSRQIDLVNRQIDYYVDVLPKDNPVNLRRDDAAVKHAQEYLRGSTGPDQLYSNVIAEVVKGAPSVLVSDHVNGYKQVISTLGEVPFQFTSEGRAKFEKIADASLSNAPSADVCVIGANEAQAAMASREQIRQLKAKYYRNYAESWKSFLAQTNVRGFSGAADVPGKLELLAEESPVLIALLRFVSYHTTFEVQKAGASEEAATGLIDRGLSGIGLGGAKQKAQKAKEAVDALQGAEFGPAGVNRMFEPVHVTASADSSTVVTDKNSGYVNGLRGIRQAFETYVKNPLPANAPPADQNAAIAPLTQAVATARAAQQSLADSFRQDTEGVSDRLKVILLQPINEAERWIPKPPQPPKPIDPNDVISLMCDEIRPILQKYPFARSGRDEAKADDVSLVFAPETGRVWLRIKPIVNVFLARKGSRWEGTPDAKPPVSAKGLEFLSRAQQLTDALFAGGGPPPKWVYTLRRSEGQKVAFKLNVNGVQLDAALQTQFYWPGNGVERVTCTMDPDDSGCGSYSGLWAVFKLFDHAEDRQLGETKVTWKKIKAPEGEEQTHPPISVDILNLPGSPDILNPHFFEPLRACPSRTIARE